MDKSSPRPKSFRQDNNLCYFPKLCLYMLLLCSTLLLLSQIQSLQQSRNLVFKYITLATQDPGSISQKLRLRDSVTFLPLKDVRFANQPLDGHTWFMSSMNDTHEEGEVPHQHFPSESSKGRLLCLKGRDTHDGSWNYYALAWPQALPSNATLMKGLTFEQQLPNPRQMGALLSGRAEVQDGAWLNTLTEATFGQAPYIEGFKDIEDDSRPVCFEKAVVMRHNEAGMSMERRLQVYDHVRCKARVYCNVSLETRANQDIGMTLLMRTGARSFRNHTAVIGIFEKECNKVKGCRLMVAYSNNLTVCQQVKLMSLTDILISPHGAQLTNMFLMDRNSSVMEFFPKGWLKVAGVGQYVYHWLASWSGMRHQGAWRDPDGENCPYSFDNSRCMSFYKNGLIRHNETQFAEWARNVLNDVKTKKSEEEASKQGSAPIKTCDCS
ncbi:hypothetical protein V6N13_089683 [Hibiscus sabdariffa]|uniref:Glycosyltransferase 61 catalytic domain-containing protein n=1 Tax=Hibiscus sabdariffa TaxID=183260 RepID=A0ABR2QJ29_9ROSI